MRLLVWLMGGKYTSQLTNINTFLVCRQSSTTKESGELSEATNGKAQNGENGGDHQQKEDQQQSNTALKIQKAKKWGVNIVNGVWLSELYLGNTYALVRPIPDRYTALDCQNHFYFDPILTREFMDQWKQLISLPVEAIRQAKLASSPLKQANRTLPQFAPVAPRFTRPISPTSSYDREAKIPRMYV